jgi:hypothetical protein
MQGNTQARFDHNDGGEQSVSVPFAEKKTVSSWVHLLAGAYVLSGWYRLDSSDIFLGAAEWLLR